MRLSATVYAPFDDYLNRQKMGEEKMVAIHGVCDSCDRSSEDLTRVRRGGKIKVCSCCNGWVRMSLRRTRRVPGWIRRAGQKMEQGALSEMREKFLHLHDRNGRDRWAERRMVFEMGFPYQGPLNNTAWGLALSALELERVTLRRPLPSLRNTEVTIELARLEEVGAIHLPSNPQMRTQIAHLLRGDYDLPTKRRFVAALFIWLVGEDEFLARDPGAWALSFQFLKEVVDDLGERASFVDDSIRVTGSSGNIYRISPRPHPPYYVVSREHEGGRQAICIDPLNAHTVVFGDILVNLVLALYDDQISARHIDTLAPHVFGGRRHRRAGHYPRNNIDHLWRRALGNMPPGEVPDAHALFQQWRRVVDRFQTNLDDWAIEEEEEG